MQLETHEKMINNLIVETLDPSNVVAQMYSSKYNNFIRTKSRQDYVKLSKYLK